MKVLTQENYKEYLYKVYSSWLGKIIGIRLGSPVESWDDKKIEETYHHQHGYLCDYGIYAADDDSNGPLFFVRALLDKNNITSEDIGNTFLNYIQEYSGFFWWGGVGVSTEHTAYENLKNGIKAPKSGSADTNGIAIAEQIGGQIFSDCWGYVSGYDAELAKDLAIKASSVTHDKNGIEGGIFVAVAICLAMQEKDIYTVIDKALTYLNKDMHYYQVMKDIRNFYHNNPEDYQLCFDYIKKNYGYDKYPGVCHIIPNAALMMMAMLYGHGDFDYTMETLNNCGWDTDCNCGNVGSILGALLGVDQIDKKWITPINDILNASSCIGSENITTVSGSAKMFAKLAYQLKNIKIEDNNHFDLPYSTDGFIGNVKVNSGLVCHGEVKKYSYYLGKDIYDSRYDPEFSPIVYPGYTIQVKANKEIKVFVETLDGKRYEGINQLVIPSSMNSFIHQFGFIGDDYVVYDYTIEHTPIIDYDFGHYMIDVYGPRYGGDDKYNLRGFVVHHGTYELKDGLILNGMITSGCLEDKYHSIEFDIDKKKDYNFSMIFNGEGYMHYDALCFKDNEVSFIHKDNEIDVVDKKEFNFDSKLKITIVDNKICINDKVAFDCALNEFFGLYGMESNKLCTIKKLVID